MLHRSLQLKKLVIRNSLIRYSPFWQSNFLKLAFAPLFKTKEGLGMPVLASIMAA